MTSASEHNHNETLVNLLPPEQCIEAKMVPAELGRSNTDVPLPKLGRMVLSSSSMNVGSVELRYAPQIPKGNVSEASTEA